MERLNRNLGLAKRAHLSWDEALGQETSTIVRDAAIQRFEYTFEIFYKTIKEYLRVREGVVVSAPKAIFREAFSCGLVSVEETAVLLEMTDDRNRTSHTYNEEAAEKIFIKLRDYSNLIGKILDGMEG